MISTDLSGDHWSFASPAAAKFCPEVHVCLGVCVVLYRYTNSTDVAVSPPVP